MKSLEPAGWERGGGSSAESPVQAWAGDGPGGKTSGTVRGPLAAGALSAYRTVTPPRRARCRQERGLCRLFLYHAAITELYNYLEGIQMKFNNPTGSIVAMITPFHEDGSVNFDALTQLLERQIAAGTDGILTLGTTGEYPTMSHEEDASVVAHTVIGSFKNSHMLSS